MTLTHDKLLEISKHFDPENTELSDSLNAIIKYRQEKLNIGDYDKALVEHFDHCIKDFDRSIKMDQSTGQYYDEDLGDKIDFEFLKNDFAMAIFFRTYDDAERDHDGIDVNNHQINIKLLPFDPQQHQVSYQINIDRLTLKLNFKIDKIDRYSSFHIDKDFKLDIHYPACKKAFTTSDDVQKTYDQILNEIKPMYDFLAIKSGIDDLNSDEWVQQSALLGLLQHNAENKPYQVNTTKYGL